MNTALHIEDWLDYADSLGLEIVEVTKGTNGYPKNLSKAVIGFDTWEEAEEFAKETEREIVRMTKRDGHQFWWSEGREFEPLKPTVAWYGDTFEAFESQDQWWESEKEFLQELFANGISSEAFKDEINRLIEIYNTFDGLEDNEQVVTESHAFPEIVPIETMRWHDKDVTDYVIAVK